MFEDLVAKLEALQGWTVVDIEAAVRAAVEATGAGVGDGMMAVRVGACGRPASPPLFESIHAIGRATVLVRLRHVCTILGDTQLLRTALATAQQDLTATQAALTAATEAAAGPKPAASES